MHLRFALFLCHHFASNEIVENGINPKSLKIYEGKKLADFILKDVSFDCIYFVAVFDKDDKYVTGKSDRKWMTNEEDCNELIDGIIQKFTAQYPVEKGFCVENRG